MKLTPTIYSQYKRTADNAYMDMYNTILEAIQDNDESKGVYTHEQKPEVLQQEQDDLTLDIMLSNILGTVTTFEETRIALALMTETCKICNEPMNTIIKSHHHN